MNWRNAASQQANTDRRERPALEELLVAGAGEEVAVEADGGEAGIVHAVRMCFSR